MSLRVRAPWEWGGWLLMLAALALVCPLAYQRSVNFGGSDFHRFHAAGKYVLEHGERQERTILAYYLPSLDVAWAPLGALPLAWATLVWYALMVGCWLALLRAVACYVLPDAAPLRKRQAVLAAGLLTLPLVLDHLCLGAFHILMLWLMVSGLGRIAIGRWPSGGAFLGLAVWVKLLPGLAVGYLLYKGKWKPALVALLTALAVDVGLSLAAYGPQLALAEHRVWWQQQGHGATLRTLVGSEQSAEHRSKNQSLAVVLRRTLAYTTVFEADGSISFFGLADLPLPTVRRLHTVAMAALGLGLLYLWRRRVAYMTPADWGCEIALLCLATLWLSPIVWSYHGTAVAPALAVIISRHGRGPGVVNAAIGAWLLGMALLGVTAARGYGELYWCTCCLAGILLWAWRHPPVGAPQALPSEPAWIPQVPAAAA